MRRLPIMVAAALLAATALAVPSASSGHTAVTKKVQLGDDYYAPATLTIHRGDSVKWIWGSLGNTHDVKLAKGPSGVKHFHSPQAAADFSYKRRLTVPGTYHIICTLHIDMTMKIVVRH